MILLESIINRTTWIDIDLRSIDEQCFHAKRHYFVLQKSTYNVKRLQAVSFPVEDKI